MKSFTLNTGNKDEARQDESLLIRKKHDLLNESDTDIEDNQRLKTINGKFLKLTLTKIVTGTNCIFIRFLEDDLG